MKKLTKEKLNDFESEIKIFNNKYDQFGSIYYQFWSSLAYISSTNLKLLKKFIKDSNFISENKIFEIHNASSSIYRNYYITIEY